MTDKIIDDQIEDLTEKNHKKDKKNYLIHLGLFILTLVTTTIAGMELTTGVMNPFEFSDLLMGLPYSLSLLFILGVHEFGHYFATVYHKVKATLPYFIPIPPIPGFFNFGTLGAVIRTKSAIYNNKAMFDIGIAGPLSGFIACLIILVYGFTHLPGKEYILQIHPDFFSPDYGKGAIGLEFGNTLLFSFFKIVFTHPGEFFPPMSEIYHYPYLCVGWFGLFVTSMNMVPVGQLDGGHIVYSMFGGKTHEAVAGISMLILIGLGMLGFLDVYLELNIGFGWAGWLLWSFILYVIIKVKHPPVYIFDRLDKRRRILGWVSLFILLISFSPTPFMISSL